MKCENCGANASRLEARCNFCNSPLDPREALDEDMVERVRKVAEAMNEDLEEKKDSHPVLYFLFLILGGGLILAFLFFDAYFDSFWKTFVATGLAGLVLLVFFGGWVDYLGNRSIKKNYRRDILPRINAYLEQTGIARYSFDSVASKHLARGAALQRFLWSPKKRKIPEPGIN